MAYRNKNYKLATGQTVLDVPLGSDTFDGNFVVHLKQGAGETAIIASVSQVFYDADGAATATALSTTAITAGVTLSVSQAAMSSVIRVTLSGAPSSSDTSVDVVSKF